MDTAQKLYWYYLSPKYPATLQSWRVSRLNALNPAYPVYFGSAIAVTTGYLFGTGLVYPEISIGVYDQSIYVYETELNCDTTTNRLNGFKPKDWQPIPPTYNGPYPKVLTPDYQNYMIKNLRLELALAREGGSGSEEYVSSTSAISIETEYTDKYYKKTHNTHITNVFKKAAPVIVNNDYNGTILYEYTMYAAPTSIDYSVAIEELTEVEYNSEVSAHEESYEEISYGNSSMPCYTELTETSWQYYTLNDTVYKWGPYVDSVADSTDSYFTYDGREYTDIHSSISYHHVRVPTIYAKNTLAFPITFYSAKQDTLCICEKDTTGTITTNRDVTCVTEGYDISFGYTGQDEISSIVLQPNSRTLINSQEEAFTKAKVVCSPYIGNVPGDTFNNTTFGYEGSHILQRNLFYCWKPIVSNDLMTDS